jgi:hypothetical protein
MGSRRNENDTNSRVRRVLALTLLAGSIGFLCLTAGASAAQTHLFIENFGGASAPVFHEFKDLALDPANQELLTVERANVSGAGNIRRFNLNGEAVSFSGLGENTIDGKKGPGGKACPEEPASCDATPQEGLNFGESIKGSDSSTTQIAVDHSGALTSGDIYITQHENHLVDIFSSDGDYLGQITGAGPTEFGSNEEPSGVAVGPQGELFVAGWISGKIFTYTQAGIPHSPLQNSDNTRTLLAQSTIYNLAFGSSSLFAVGSGVKNLNPTSGALQYSLDPNAKKIAFDPTTNSLFVADAFSFSPLGLVNEYAGQTLLSRRGLNASALAYDGEAERLYIAPTGLSPEDPEDLHETLKVYGPRVAVPDVASLPAEVTGETSLRIRGTVNPEGSPIEECAFEYGTSNGYGNSVPCSEPGVAEIGNGKEAVEVHADLSGLQKETTYHFRLKAANANAVAYPNDESAIPVSTDETARTPGKPNLKAGWAMNVGLNEAALKATINPENAETKYRFEWGSTDHYGEATAERVLAPGRDTEDHTVGLVLHGLVPGSTYHYRVVAVNSIGSSPGADQSFTTFRTPQPESACPANEAFRLGRASFLSDCRAYEMVSPVDKNHGDIVTLNNTNLYPAGLDQASTSGSGLAYAAATAFGSAQAAPFNSQYVASRTEDGWTTHDVSPLRERLLYSNLGSFETEFKAFSPDLCEAWLEPETEPKLTADAVTGYPNIYRRHDEECGGPSFEAVTTVKPPHLTPVEYGTANNQALEFQGASADGSKALYAAPDNLTENAPRPPSDERELYLAEGDRTTFVCVLPNGLTVAEHCSAGSDSQAGTGPLRRASLFNAISVNGQRVFWSDASLVPGRVYVRENPTAKQSKVAAGKCTQTTLACTIAISAAAEQEEGTHASVFWGAADDGSVAIFTTGNGLYEFDVDAGTTARLARGAVGVMGMSEDAKWIYFASTEALGGPNAEGNSAVSGKVNLYLLHGGATRFIASLSAKEGELGLDTPTPISPVPVSRVSRVSPDGRNAVFMTQAKQPGVENADAETDTADAEVYIYDAEAQRLHCVSCNPTGARPLGIVLRGGYRAAGAIPAWATTLYAPRPLSADGRRVFFESADALVPGDTNGVTDVYEWEAAGAGTCSETAPSFSAPNGGCLSLISSGQSPLASHFVDAGPSGGDVFISTLESLVAWDPGLVDIYDARVDGGFPPPPAVPAQCEGESCLPAAQAPNDQTPTSAAFSGPGNVKQESASSKCPKGKRRSAGKGVHARCTKPAKRHHGKRHHPVSHAGRERKAR